MGDLWISSPTLYHCATLISGFHLWQFQVFNSGAEGMVMVLFWYDLGEIFFLPTPGFELGTSGSLVLHSITVTRWLLVFTSDNLRYLTLVQRDWWWYTSDWTQWKIFFFAHTRLWTGGHLDLYSCTLPLCQGNICFSHLIIAGISLCCRGIGGGIVLSWTCERFSFCPQPGFELGTSGSLGLPSTTVP